MSFVDQPRARLALGPLRMLAAAVAASAVPSVMVTLPSLVDAWPLFFMGCVSIFTLYLPLVLWRLPRSRHPFLTCVILGALAAPGPIGIGLAIGLAIGAIGGVGTLIFVLGMTAPLGAVGGAVFWFGAVWKNPDFAPDEV